MINEKIISFLALIVACLSAAFSFMQFRASDAQVRLNEQQLRPHVSYIPTFYRFEKALDIKMYLQNQSSLPANVLYTDIAVWIGDEYLATSFHSINPDIIYEDKGGSTLLPPIEGKPFLLIDQGHEKLTIATCAIYTSTSKADSRKWLIQGLHAYKLGEILPERHLMQENEVSASTELCTAKEVRGLYMKTTR